MSSAAVSNLQMFIRPDKPINKNEKLMEEATLSHKLLMSIVPLPAGQAETCACGKVLPSGLMAAHRPTCNVHGRDARRQTAERVPAEERRRRRHDGLR